MFPTLRIDTTDAQIGLNIERPPLQIKQQQAQMDISQRHIDLISISTKAAQLYIDQTEAFADANLKGPLRMANDFWQKTPDHVYQYIRSVAEEGDRLMRIEEGKNPIAQIAAEHSAKREVETNIGYMPRSMSRVLFRYDPGEVLIEASYEEVDIKVQTNKPRIHIPKWQTSAYMRQKNSITFEVIGKYVNDRY